MEASQTSSRIFVRGLPQSLNEDDFKKHFSAAHSVTDVRLLPHRRIGYVGYKTPQEAKDAVKHFNKSFIRMSKIGVELARPIGEGIRHAQSNTSANGHNQSRSTNESESNQGRKRKRNSQEPESRNAKLSVFLEAMQPNRNSDTNPVTGEDSVHSGQTVNQTRSTTTPQALDGEEYQILQQRNRSKKQSSREEQIQAPGERSNPLGDDISAKRRIDKEEELTNPVNEAGAEGNDQDWLRNRTNRVLDLVDEEMDQPTKNENTVTLDTEENHLMHVPSRPKEVAEVAGDPIQSSSLPDSTDHNRSSSTDIDTILSTGRLFLRNIAYNATATDIEVHFQEFGELDEVHVPLGFESGSNKGFAYVQFKNPECAVQAFRDLDGTVFQGRLLHVLPSTAKRDTGLDNFALSKLPLKKQKLIRRKAEAASSTFNWNSLYMNADAVVSSVADRLGVSKSTLLDPTSSDAAVKQAHAETHVIQETKAYFSEKGVNLDAFRTGGRGDTAILAKNFPYEMKAGELKRLFEEWGEITQFLMPPTGTVAIIQYAQPQQARTAFGALAYRKVKDSVLYLEKAPKELFLSNAPKPMNATPGITKPALLTSEMLQGESPLSAIETSTLFVRNLSFDTSNERFNRAFKSLDGFLSARVKTKTDPKRAGQTLSMGFGFVEFRTKVQAQAALATMDGVNLDGHNLQIKGSHKGLDAAAERRKDDHARKASSRSTKIIIKNLPFEATKKDVRSLFGAYGQLRSVRVPKKFDKGTRGFAFADFTTTREAENAIESLRNTHLLGRRLVLEFAAAEPEDAEAEIEKMQKKVGSQANKVAIQKLTGSTRKKFNVSGNEDDDV